MISWSCEEKQPNSTNSVHDFLLLKNFSLCLNAFWVTGCVCRSASLCECVSVLLFFLCWTSSHTKTTSLRMFNKWQKSCLTLPSSEPVPSWPIREQGEEILKKTQKTSLATGVSQSESRTTVSGSNLFFSPSVPHRSASERKKK